MGEFTIAQQILTPTTTQFPNTQDNNPSGLYVLNEVLLFKKQ